MMNMYGKKKKHGKKRGNPMRAKESGGGVEGNPYGAGPIYSAPPMFRYGG